MAAVTSDRNLGRLDVSIARLRRAVPHPRLDVIGLTLLFAYLLYVLFSTRLWGHLSTGDSNNLVRGTRAAMRCLSNGKFFKCGYIEGTVNSYVHPYPLLQYIPTKMRFGAALIASPSGGLIWYWPVFTLVAAVGLRRLRRNPRRASDWMPVLCVSAVVMVWLASLSAWWAPFGWVTYGPRLDVPILGAATVAFVHLVGEAVVRCLERSRVLSNCRSARWPSVRFSSAHHGNGSA